MKNKSAYKLAATISAVMAVVLSCAMYFAIWGSGGDMHGWMAIVAVPMAIVVGVGATFVLKCVLDKYGNSQTRVIYAPVEPRDTVADAMRKPGDKKLYDKDVNSSEGLSQIISQVDDDVAQWARDKVNEITILRNTEKFRKEYIGNVSHELKTPLTNIQGYIETLMDGGLKDDEINMKYLERADRNISRLISIVRDLDTISKFEAGVLKLNLERFDLVDVIEEVLDSNEKRAKDKHIALKFESALREPAIVLADKERMTEVITNLVVNSINYGNENGTTVVSISDIENKYLIDVKDNGIGISEENLRRVFERFFRVDKARSTNSGGTGLGLAIVKHIMEAHNELVTVKSKIGEGSTFSVTLKKAQM